MRFVDTNVILRFLLQDEPTMGAASAALFERVDAGTEEVSTREAVIAETVYVLSSRSTYNLPRADIRDLLVSLLVLRGWRLPDRSVYLRALDLYASHSQLDFEDALAIAHMEREGIREIYSYDQDFDRVETIRRVEP